jgi:hypothetical protein
MRYSILVSAAILAAFVSIYVSHTRIPTTYEDMPMSTERSR